MSLSKIRAAERMVSPRGKVENYAGQSGESCSRVSLAPLYHPDTLVNPDTCLGLFSHYKRIVLPGGPNRSKLGLTPLGLLSKNSNGNIMLFFNFSCNVIHFFLQFIICGLDLFTFVVLDVMKSSQLKPSSKSSSFISVESIHFSILACCSSLTSSVVSSVSFK